MNKATPAWCSIHYCTRWAQHVEKSDRHDVEFMENNCDACSEKIGGKK